MVKVYGIAAVGQKGLLMCPFVDEAAREEAYTTLGGVVEPKAINLGLMTKTDKGKKLRLKLYPNDIENRKFPIYAIPPLGVVSEQNG